MPGFCGETTTRARLVRPRIAPPFYVASKREIWWWMSPSFPSHPSQLRGDVDVMQEGKPGFPGPSRPIRAVNALAHALICPLRGRRMRRIDSSKQKGNKMIEGNHSPNSAPATRLLTRSEEHTSELQSHVNLVCRLLLEKKN